MLLICMSIAGTIPLVICLLLLIIQRKKFSYRLGRKLVFLSLAGYLIPFQVVKYLMPTDMLEVTDSIVNTSDFMKFDNKEAISYGGFSVWMSDWILMIGLCWLFLVIGFSIYEIIKYQRLTRKLKRITEIRTCFLPGIGDVEYRISPLIRSPYTIGFFRPFVVAPKNLEDSRLSEMILRHEYSHLKCRDSAVKLFCLLAICLHFFNPLTLLTLLLYTSFSENIADEAATTGSTLEERKAYAVALVNLSIRDRQVPVVWKNNLLGDRRNAMKRRVEFFMMGNRKVSKIGTVAAVVASVILSGATVFAYVPMQTVEDFSYDTEQDAITFTDDTNSQIISDNTSESNSYTCFVGNDGTISTDVSETLDSRAIICTHDFVTGYADKHYSKSNGGCEVKRYTAKKCKKCNHLVIMDYIGTYTYPTCPHK